ncbi:MAG: chlorite dismutase family protein [Nitriliruptoraceae bacterium]
MALDAVTPGTGWGVLHLMLKVDHTAVAGLPDGAAKDVVATLERWQQRVQLHVFSGVGHKADVLLMAIADDLTELRALQTEVAATRAAPALRLDWSYLSLTEGSEYTTTPERYREEMAAKGLDAEELERRVEQYAERMAAYQESKLHPQMPDWQLLCFYPMSHRRDGADNWYVLDFEERKRMMSEHGRSGRAFTGRVLQLVSASTGLDDWEYAVSLFAHDLADIKSIVYDLRYDEASARYAEFGPFVIGIRREPADLVSEIGLDRAG